LYFQDIYFERREGWGGERPPHGGRGNQKKIKDGHLGAGLDRGLGYPYTREMRSLLVLGGLLLFAATAWALPAEPDSGEPVDTGEPAEAAAPGDSDSPEETAATPPVTQNEPEVQEAAPDTPAAVTESNAQPAVPAPAKSDEAAPPAPAPAPAPGQVALSLWPKRLGAAPVVLVAVGAATMAVGIVFGVEAQIAYDHARDPALDGRQVALAHGRRSQDIANVALGVGGATIAAGLAAWLWDYLTADAVSVAPRVGPGTVGLSVELP
jgi:hypothetical protein